ncbi:MAG TPA: FHA domain-containing protein [Actinoplanes sp.]|nr:FHA domain-containing protein [Actinoplanes sp.]
MTTSICPKGHASSTDDFCDTCGAKIGGTMAIPVTPAAPVSSPPASGTPCPHCGTPRTGNWRFCEDCGYDHNTGKVPTLDVAPPAARGAGQWTATVAADRAYFEANAIEGVEFPANAPSRTVDLPAPQVRIGRKSRSKGTDPELDLSAEPLDPGVSHSHALLTLNIDGVWLVSDLGSTNGTYLNDEPRPLTAGQTRTLSDGDRVHVGAWTTITLHAPQAA